MLEHANTRIAMPTPPTALPDDESTMEWAGFTFRTILSVGEGDGSMSIVDSVVPPASGPPRHVHEREDETFVVLTGTLEFWLEGERFVRGPGETAHVPKGCEHTFRVVSPEPSRHLVILSPGGFENFFAEMARGGFAIPDDMPAIEEAASRHALRFTGPPLGDG